MLYICKQNNTTMSKIFCLETEWVKSVHDLKSDSYVKPLLEFLLNTAPHSGILIVTLFAMYVAKRILIITSNI